MEEKSVMNSGDKVELHGLNAKSMNGREGTIVGNDTAKPGRVRVMMDGKEVSIKSENLHVTEAAAPLEAAAPIAAIAPDLEQPKNRPRPAALTGRSGKYKVGYDWREVLEGQEIPRGIEVMSSFEEGVIDIARIPPRWMLDVEFGEERKKVRVQIEGRGMKVREVIERVEEKTGEVRVLIVYLDGVKWEDMEATVEKANLFNVGKVACRLT